ncbi:MAG: DUF421 domain-containing protein [Gemmataceae bacterium]
MDKLWQTDIEWWQFPIRAVVVYAFLIILLRITGKRQIGQLAPFDLVLLLILSNAVQNSMNGGDNSITGGLILATTLVVLNGLVAVATYRSKWLERLIEGRPVLLIHNGHIDRKAMAGVRMTMHELLSSLRAAGCAGPEEVHVAILENNGTVTTIRMADKNHAGGHSMPPPGTVGG